MMETMALAMETAVRRQLGPPDVESSACPGRHFETSTGEAIDENKKAERRSFPYGRQARVPSTILILT
jgi:hypothetical protein